MAVQPAARLLQACRAHAATPLHLLHAARILQPAGLRRPAAQLRRPERKALGAPAPGLSGSAPRPHGPRAHAAARAARLALARSVRLLPRRRRSVPRRRSPLRDEPAEVELGIWPVDWGMEFPCEWRGNGWPVDRVGSRCWNWASTIWDKPKNGWAFCSGWPNNGDGGRLQP